MYARTYLCMYSSSSKVPHVLQGTAAAPFPRGFVYRTARRGEDNGPIERMEGHLGYATHDAFDFFKDGEQGGLDAALRLKRNSFSLFFSHRENNLIEKITN